MSESEPSEAQLQEDLFQSDDVDQPEQPFVEDFELQSVEEATALLRSCWKFAAVIQFSRMFAAPLKLKVFAADILESALISPDNHRMFLSELLFKLLRTDALQPYSEKDSEGWENLLYRKVSTKWPEHFESHPLLGTTFYDITPTKRVDLLFALCDWRVHDCPVVKDVIKRTVEMADSSVDGLRHEPVGEDTKGNLYYYFSFNNEDCRLYRQEPPFKKSAKRRRSGGEDAQWETVCTTVEEMADFIESLSAARSGKDKALHDLIATDILPQLIESAAARRRAEEKQAAIEAMPKKRSSRLQELTSKKEEEDKRKAQQLAEKLHRQRENERIRKEREREDRLLARQREDERQIEIQRKLAGIHPEAPSREERLHRRLKSSQASSSSDSGGIQTEQSPHNARCSARLHAQQQQQAQQQSSPPPHAHHHPQHHEQEYHQSQHQRQHQQPARQAQSRQQAQHAQHDPADSSDHAQSGLLTRLRPRSTRRRTFQETFAWSPLDVPVPQRRRTDLDLRPRKNVAGLVAAAQGMSTGFGRNRRGKWVLNDQVEEVGVPEVRGRSGSRPRSTKAASLSTAGPSSPAASWDSGAGRTQPKKLPHYVSRQQQYALEPEPTTSYGQQQQPQQQQQQWQDPYRSGYATQSAPYASSSTMWQQPQQQQQPQQVSQQQQMTAQKAELESLVQQLTPQQRQHLATMPHDKRMQFFMNLRNQMARAQQAQQLQQQQQMSQRGAWQQGPGLQQAGPGAMHQSSASAQPATQSSQQQQQQQQQYQQQLQQLTLSRLSPQQMQQLHALPVEQRAMQFGSYMRETQLQLQQQQHMQQQFPSQAMPTYSSSMVPVGQSQQQQQTGMSSQSQVAMQQQRGVSQQMPMRQMAMQQQGHSQAMYSQAGIMRQQPSGYPSMGQAYPSSTGEQTSRPMSPPGLPRGPSNPMVVAQSQRSQVKSPTGGYLGPQMIRPQMVGQQMAGNQLAGARMAGNQMAGVSGHAMPPNSPSAMRSSSPGMASGGSSNGSHQPTAQPQQGPQATHSPPSRPNSASSAEGSGSAGQRHEAMLPKGRTVSSFADQSQQSPRFQSTAGHAAAPMQQPSYGQNAYGLGWNGGMQTGSGSYANPGQPGIMQGPSMQAQRPSPAGMAMHGQGAHLDQNRLAMRPGLVPAHLQHPAGSSPVPTAPSLKTGVPAPSASLQVPVTGQLTTNQLTSAHSSGNAMSHLGQTVVGSGQATNPYGSRNGMPAGLYNNGGSQSANPYAVGGTSQGMGTYGSIGTNPYSGVGPRSGGVSVPNGVVPVQSGAGPQTSLLQLQKQPSAAADQQQTQTAVAPQAGPVASSEGAALNPAAAASSQDPSQQAAANDMPGKSVLGATADAMQDVKQPGGVQLAPSNQESADTSDLDVLADAPQLIEPPMVGGQENFSDGLFAD